MRRHPRRKARTITAALNNTRHERRAVQLVHLFWDANVLVHKRFVVRYHILIGRLWVGGFLEGVCGFGEEMAPEDCGDELQEGDDV
jgi:hypothetical protein